MTAGPTTLSPPPLVPAYSRRVECPCCRLLLARRTKDSSVLEIRRGGRHFFTVEGGHTTITCSRCGTAATVSALESPSAGFGGEAATSAVFRTLGGSGT